MSEEQMRILKMLAEGKITVEQAESLLEALGRKPEPMAGPAQEAMEKLSKVIGGVVGGGNGLPWGLGHQNGEDGGEEVGPEGVELPDDAEMVLKVRGGNVCVRPSTEGRTATFGAAGGARPRVRLDRRTCFVDVRPHGGQVELSVPELRSLTVRLMGGRADVAGVTGSLRANVKGGDLCATDCHGSVSVKCLGGNVSVGGRPEGLDVNCMGGGVTVDGLFIESGRHAVKVLGGSLSLSFAPGASVTVRTEILGGDVRTDLAPVGEESGLARRRAEYRIGAGEGTLAVKLFGGDVTISEAAASDAAAVGTAQEDE